MLSGLLKPHNHPSLIPLISENQPFPAYSLLSFRECYLFKGSLQRIEKERMETLLYDYQVYGKFPENGLEIVDDEKMITADTLAFITEDSMFVFAGKSVNR